MLLSLTLTSFVAYAEDTPEWLGHAGNQAGSTGVFLKDFGVQNTVLEPGESASGYFSAPHSGVYALQIRLSSTNGTATVHIASGKYYAEFILSHTDWTEGKSGSTECDQPMYFEAGTHKVVITNAGTTTFEFGNSDVCALNKDGFDDSVYLPLVKVLDTPIQEDIGILPWVALIPEETVGTVERYLSTNATLPHGESIACYGVEVPAAGIYRVQAKIGGTTKDPYPLIWIDANDTYRAYLQTGYVNDAGAWRATDADGNYQYLYLNEGFNKLKVHAQHTHHVLQSIELKALDATEQETITIEDCKLISAITDTDANGGVNELTFYGKVSADHLDEDYGVEVAGKKFYGAKDGDTVSDGAEGTTTFTFGDWDGTFEIVLTNITEKGTAGEKTYRFFVGDTYTDAATVTVE